METPQALPGGPGDLARRLDRLRQLRQPGATTRIAGVAGGRADARGQDEQAAWRREARAGRDTATARAARLASALGGVSVDSGRGRFVRVEAAFTIPLEPERLAALPYPIDARHPLLCLDTETTGLGTAAGTLVFLVGLGTWDGERFTVVQLVLPDQPDEPAFLAALRSAIPEDAWLVTYNGRGFDWPLLVTRFRLQRSPPPPVAGHLDLLPIARQLWRHRLEDARLASVEAGVVGVSRSHDLPGALIPARYLEFLRGGRAEALCDVVDHNRQDVVSLGLLVAHLAAVATDEGQRARVHHGDLAGLSRAYARRRRWEEALACSTEAVGRCDDRRERDRLAAGRARLLRSAGRRQESAEAWAELADRGGPMAAIAWIQLAKHREHELRDLAGAVAATERAALIVERARLLGRELPRLERDLVRRRARLRRRVARSRHLVPAAAGGPRSPGTNTDRARAPELPAGGPLGAAHAPDMDRRAPAA